MREVLSEVIVNQRRTIATLLERNDIASSSLASAQAQQERSVDCLGYRKAVADFESDLKNRLTLIDSLKAENESLRELAESSRAKEDAIVKLQSELSEIKAELMRSQDRVRKLETAMDSESVSHKEISQSIHYARRVNVSSFTHIEVESLRGSLARINSIVE